MEDVVPGSPSSLSSDNSDSDGVNTSSARIYFGEFRTPEKKLAALVDSTSVVQPTPINASTPGPSTLRRSPRLSEPPVRDDAEPEITSAQQSEEEDEEDEDEDGSTEDSTDGGPGQEPPFLEFLRKDEPSSAIASRIIRAHDNPSPPPKALRSSLTPRSAPRKLSGLVFPLVPPSSAESSDAAVESLLQPRDSLTPPPVLPSLTPRRTPPTQQETLHSPAPRNPSNVSSSRAAQGDAEADLISFDRSVLISTPDGVKLHSPSPKHAQQLTIDDLLFSSPPQAVSPNANPQTTERNNGQTSACEGPLLNEAKTQEHDNKRSAPASDNRAEHAEVKDLPKMPETPSQTLEQDSRAQMTQQEDQKTPVARLPIPNSSPSLRRSPRLSSLPQPSLQDTIHVTTPSRTPKSKSKFPGSTGSQARKRRRSSTEKASRKSISPKKWAAESEESDNETDAFQSPSKRTRRDRKRVKKGTESPSDAIDARLAESLPPSSAHILSALVFSESLATTSEVVTPSTPKRPGPASLTAGDDNESLVKPSAPPISSSIQRPPPGVFTPFAITPSRGTSSKSFLVPNSPVKVSLTPASRDDPNRTPARRIPIKEANKASTPHLASTGQLNDPRNLPVFTRPPVFSRPPPETNDPNRSPAKRVPIAQATERKPVLRTEKNTTSKNLLNAKNRSRGAGTEPADTRADNAENKPVPNADTIVVSSSKTTLTVPSSISNVPAPEKSSMVPSTSKPAPKAESRIPRPGTTSKPSSSQKSKLPLPSTRKPNNLSSASSRLPSPKKPISRVSRMQINSSSNSDDSASSQAGNSGVGTSRKALNSSLAKRKRDAEKPPSRPMIKMRQVIPGMYGGPVKTTALNGTEKAPPASEDQQAQTSPVKPVLQNRPIKAREVVKGTLQNFELRAASSKMMEALSEQRAKEREELERAKQQELEKARQEAQREPSPPAPSLEAFTFECAVSERREERMDVETTASAPTSDSLPPSDDTVDVEMHPNPEEPQLNGSGARRSTRARRAPSTDVFGAVSSTHAPASGSSRRKPGTGQAKSRATSLPPNLLFSTNGYALKSVTNSNTARNQHYLAQLEMNIIRKVGNRPESPTMKLRSIVEKQKEDQDKMRAERARRRRGEGSDESGDFSMDEHSDMQPLRHRRGPGDEEDYETPVRPNDGRKAVKWDRGLEVSMFLDEIEVQPRRYRCGEGTSRPRKGCLINAANRAPLDGLGNPVNADAPLDLVPEKVVVTKFIYDNDEEAVLFDPPAPKATRGKAKKK